MMTDAISGLRIQQEQNVGNNIFPKILTIEGNIGVGKTYLGSELAKALGYKVMLEPVAKNPYLDKFYEDPKKYALKLQIWIYRQRYRTYLDAVHHIITTGQGVILDRSVFSDKLFADANLLEGNITREGYDHYIKLRTQSLSKLPWPHVTVVLLASPIMCSTRIAKRSRTCESAIPLDYLKLLDAGHSSFLQDMKLTHTKLVCMDWSSFGTARDVLKQLEVVGATPWPDDIGRGTLLMARTEAAIRNALFVANPPIEAIIEDDSADNNSVFEAEQLLHDRERAAANERSNNNNNNNNNNDDVNNTEVVVKTVPNFACADNVLTPGEVDKALNMTANVSLPTMTTTSSTSTTASPVVQSATKRRLFSQSEQMALETN